MSDNTGISYADATWSPVTGCSSASAGCLNCWAKQFSRRFSKPGQWGEGWERGPRFRPEELEKPLHWRKPRRILTCSVGDLFHEDVYFGHVAAMFAVMASTPQHTYLVLTKRHERMAHFFEWLERTAANAQVLFLNDPLSWRRGQILAGAALRKSIKTRAATEIAEAGWPLSNVWLGCSVEDQAAADARLPILLELAARGWHTWASVEPLLGPVDLQLDAGCESGGPQGWIASPGPEWVVVGGEAGPGARPCRVEWVRDVVRQCREAGTACYVKQIGARPRANNVIGWNAHMEWNPDGYSPRLRSRSGADPDEWPPDLRVREFPEVKP